MLRRKELWTSIVTAVLGGTSAVIVIPCLEIDDRGGRFVGKLSYQASRT